MNYELKNLESINMQIQQLRNKLERKKGEALKVEQDISILETDIQKKKRELRLHEQALIIVIEVGKKTQEQISFHISDITSLALSSIFPDPYTLEVEFVQRHNKSECDLYFVRNENKVNPLKASGGGTVDVACFALRIASWSMQTPHRRNTIILDEPFRFVSENYQEQASTMLKEISKRLGIQFIVITHSQVLASFADRTFNTTIHKGITKITTS
jgi:DNA repair exonuclease SbcCD ATPase subunit